MPEIRDDNPDMRAFAVESGGSRVASAAIDEIDPAAARARLWLEPFVGGEHVEQALVQLVDVARRLGLERVWVWADPADQQSAEVLNQLGFERDSNYDGPSAKSAGFSRSLHDG